ncbi:hypothetical protein PV08_03579 [Exophiala spinifera]|uniref:L-ornithine N(5)-oxygenase n=1 Tax=Exophiala spinifera TaxID=91928 RepID=A0A0D2BL04_9EURO|nr:uncharacterized protein PV08_03579 [Exophiala spinifera]KIW19285.1 hypothetical protein PV08_03579 [Exophiala spinifera]
MAHGLPRETDTVIVGNGPSALILSYILHGNIPCYDSSSPHPDRILHEKLLRHHDDLLNVDIDALTTHFSASRFSYSTQALPINVLLDTLVRPLGETDDAQKKTCIKWQYDPSRAVPHVVIGNTQNAGGQWVDDPVHASWDIGTLSYAGMLSLPGYSFDEHYKRRNGQTMPVYLRPSRREVADYLAAYPDKVGIAKYMHNGQHIARVSRNQDGFYIASHHLACQNLVLASGIFDTIIPPPAMFDPLVGLDDSCPQPSSDPILVIGSGFSAADVIISAPPSQKIIHVFKWDPAASPSPLRGCHRQAYPEYAGVYRRMKAAALSSSPSRDRRPRMPRSQSNFDTSRNWTATYEGLPNTKVVDVQLTSDGAGMVTFQGGGEDQPFQRRVSGLAYVVGRRGSLCYLSEELRQEFLHADCHMISGQTLRQQANEDLEIAPHVFVTGSLTGDSLIRFAYGGCAYAAGKIMGRRPRCSAQDKEIKGGNGVNAALVRKTNHCRCETPSPKIPAMNGLDGHEASPMSLAKMCNGVPLDRRKD